MEKYGKPNGVVGFSGLALDDRVFDEPASGVLSIMFPVARSRGVAGNISVSLLLPLLLRTKVKVRGLIQRLYGSTCKTLRYE